MIKYGIQYQVNRQLQCNSGLHQPIVASTYSGALYRFTVVKSGILVGFGTLPQQSGDVVARRRAGAPGVYVGGKLQAASCIT